MRTFLLMMIILFVCFFALAAENEEITNEIQETRDDVEEMVEATTEASPIVTELGMVYVGMPKQGLAEAGFTEDLQKDYYQEEWITFDNWTTEDPDDVITFHIIDGRIKEWKKE